MFLYPWLFVLLCLKLCVACADFLCIRKWGLFYLPSPIFYLRLRLCRAVPIRGLILSLARFRPMRQRSVE